MIGVWFELPVRAFDVNILCESRRMAAISSAEVYLTPRVGKQVTYQESGRLVKALSPVKVGTVAGHSAGIESSRCRQRHF